MTDKELLELAAKAAGYDFEWFGQHFHIALDDRRFAGWNPLTDDGDALRLAVKLGLSVKVDINHVGETQVLETYKNGDYESVMHKIDPYAATRRAIVRAAAEIGRTL